MVKITNKRTLPIDMSFIDRQGKLVEDYIARGLSEAGKAYAFFDCKASKGDIEAELPKVSFYAEVPSKLELILTEGPENLSRDTEAMEALEAAKKYSLSRLPKNQREGMSVSYRYVLQAKLPNATNLSTANKMNNIMNLLYGHELYPEQEEFFREIVYKGGNQYVHAH